VTVFGDRSFRKYLRLNEVIRVGSLANRTGVLRIREFSFFSFCTYIIYARKAIWAPSKKAG
jgi:hypothetical protein